MARTLITYKRIKGHWYKYEVKIEEKCLGRVSDEEALAHRMKSKGNFFDKLNKKEVVKDG